MLKISLSEAEKLNDEALCSLIVLIRNVNKNDFENISVIMSVLSKRREQGNDFKFEEYIKSLENEYSDLKDEYLFNVSQVEND